MKSYRLTVDEEISKLVRFSLIGAGPAELTLAFSLLLVI